MDHNRYCIRRRNIPVNVVAMRYLKDVDPNMLQKGRRYNELESIPYFHAVAYNTAAEEGMQVNAHIIIRVTEGRQAGPEGLQHDKGEMQFRV